MADKEKRNLPNNAGTAELTEADKKHLIDNWLPHFYAETIAEEIGVTKEHVRAVKGGARHNPLITDCLVAMALKNRENRTKVLSNVTK